MTNSFIKLLVRHAGIAPDARACGKRVSERKIQEGREILTRMENDCDSKDTGGVEKKNNKKKGAHSLPRDGELPPAAAYGTRRTRPYISPFLPSSDAFSSLARQEGFPELVPTFCSVENR